MTTREGTALTFEPVGESHVGTVDQWLQDAESQRRLGGMIPFRPCFEFIQENPDFHEWMVYDGNTAVGLAGFEIYEDGTAAAVLLVSPDRRGQGYGKRILEALCSRPELQPVNELIAPVDPDNQAALRCVRAVGFVDTGPDPEDKEFLRFVYRPEKRAAQSAREHG